MIAKLKLIGIGIALLGIGAAAGRFLAPTKTVTKTVTATVIQWRVKEVEKKVEVVKWRRGAVRVVTERIVEQPDGTRVTERTSDSRTNTERTGNTETERGTETEGTEETRRSEVRISERSLPQWRIGALVGTTLPQPSMLYGVQIERRIIGPIHLGVWGLYQPDPVSIVSSEPKPLPAWLVGGSLSFDF